jgi:hypothetical protein
MTRLILGSIALIATACTVPMESDEPIDLASSPTSGEAGCVTVESECSHFFIDSDGTVGDKQAYGCSIDVLMRAEAGSAITIGANGKDGPWTWDWELYPRRDQVLVVRRGELLDEEGQPYDATRVEICRLTAAIHHKGCVDGGPEVSCYSPDDLYDDCVEVEEPACGEAGAYADGLLESY